MPESQNLSHLQFLAPAVCNNLIRVGKHNDGGYIVPQSVLKEAEALVSCGISDDWSFEDSFLSMNPHITIHAYDHTISRALLFQRVIESTIKMFGGKSNFRSVRNCVRAWISYKTFFSGKSKHFRERLHSRKDGDHDVTVQDIFDRLKTDKIFLKIDIEGSEYRVIDEIQKYSHRIVGMVIEFHDTEPFRQLFTNAVEKLRKCFTLVHIHGNNCGPVSGDGLPEVLELTFVKGEFCNGSEKRFQLPIAGLDEPNDPLKLDYALTFRSEG